MDKKLAQFHAQKFCLIGSMCSIFFSIPQDETDKVQFQALSQSVKAICNILSKIETIDVAKSLQKVESILNQLKNSVATNAQASTLPPEHSGGGYATLQRRR